MKRIIFIASVLASSHIAFLMAAQHNAYSVANAALNMLAHKSPTMFTNDGVATAVIHSGRSQTSLAERIDKWMAKYAPHGLHFPLEAPARMISSSFLTLEKMDAFQQICFDD
jgi:NAD(P)-dependent dehydrogenase (short-subunit alcohol dehydrogenase family)